MADIIEGFVSLVRPDQAIQSICKFAKKGQIKDAKKAMEKLGITADAKDESKLIF